MKPQINIGYSTFDIGHSTSYSLKLDLTFEWAGGLNLIFSKFSKFDTYSFVDFMPKKISEHP